MFLNLGDKRLSYRNGPFLGLINNTITGRFTCGKHEGLFQPIDQLNTEEPTAKQMNLMAYKAIIYQRWWIKLRVKGIEVLLLEIEELNSEYKTIWQAESAKLRRICTINLLQDQREIEECILKGKCSRCEEFQCNRLEHTIKQIPGDPALAATQWGNSIVQENGTEEIGRWGMTVVPNDDGHALIIHYLGKQRSRLEPSILGMPQGEMTIEEMIAIADSYCENIAIKPSLARIHRWTRMDGVRTAEGGLGSYRRDDPGSNSGRREFGG